MSEESHYYPEGERIVLNSLAETDLSLLVQHNNTKIISIWLEGLTAPNLDFLLSRSSEFVESKMCYVHVL